VSAVRAQATHDLGDFAEFLRTLNTEGFEFVVIGGCAVVAYASLLGDELFSVDLDIYVTQATLVEILEWAPGQGLRIVKRPQPRSIPVAFLESADGKEINILTSATALPRPEIVTRTARQFFLSAHGDLDVPVADPFDLLANKLGVARDKDLPHIEILRRFVEEEAVTAFSEEESPRARLEPARRLLEVLKDQTLPAALADRLIELARTAPDFRFLIHRVPTERQAKRLLAAADKHQEALRPSLESILVKRRFWSG
jgi:hypothetical protein